MKNKIVFAESVGQLGVMVSAIVFAALLAALVVVVFPSISNAATYAYVNGSGQTMYVGAESFSGAFANSTNIATNSGVMLIGTASMGTPNTNQVQSSGYLYVNSSGVVSNVSADSSSEAFAHSTNISSLSGVMVIDSLADSNMTNDQVQGI